MENESKEQIIKQQASDLKELNKRLVNFEKKVSSIYGNKNKNKSYHPK